MRKIPIPLRARVSIVAIPNANITFSGTAKTTSHSVLRTAGQICLSSLNMYL